MPDVDWDTSNGTLNFVTSGTVEPMNYMRGDKLVGYDVELAMIVARELHYDITFTIGDYAAILGNVQTGKSDFGGNALSITDERKEIVDFTSPVFEGAITVIVRDLDAVPEDTNSLEGIATSFKRTFIEEDRWMLILQGLGTTVLISVVSGGLGILLGYLSVLARRSNLSWPGKLVNGYQAFMGGVPIVVVLMVLYYVVFGSFDVPGTIVAIVAFTLSFGSTSGSTMWTAVSSLDNIQEETGMALGFTRAETFHNILSPQAATVFMPQLAGQFVSMVKETSVVGYIAVLDLTRASDLIRSRTMDAFFPLISTAIIYFIFCRILAKVLNALVKRMDMSQRPKTVEGVEL
jgi:polar amino acid transport system substrate-binding protein